MTFIRKALCFADQFSHCAFYQGNGIAYPHDSFPTLLAIGAEELFDVDKDSFSELAQFHQGEWLFGYLGYDLKNQIEDLESSHANHTQFKNISFFKPQILIEFNENTLEIEAEVPQQVFEAIQLTQIDTTQSTHLGPIQAKINRNQYVDTVQNLRKHIEEGDIYEINFCQEFYGEIHSLKPLDLYWALNEKSPTPFSTFQKFDDQYLLCASPERFLKKQGQQLISQPIKGTIRRGTNPEEDAQLQYQLRHDEKELAENMMIVDLVRNDLAKSSQIGSVQVEEMFGIYAFQQVHQMISTITSQVKPDLCFSEVLKNAFPMGSMTGAPKVKVMELIEQYEMSKRGIFSGAAGYITPEGNFDFNVIIRSLFLNMKDNLYSFQVGGAITYDSVPEKEYEECLLKASAIRSILGSE